MKYRVRAITPHGEFCSPPCEEEEKQMIVNFLEKIGDLSCLHLQNVYMSKGMIDRSVFILEEIND